MNKDTAAMQGVNVSRLFRRRRRAALAAPVAEQTLEAWEQAIDIQAEAAYQRHKAMLEAETDQGDSS